MTASTDRVLTFIFTVVSDLTLVPSLTVTARNRKHFEVFVGASAITTVRFISIFHSIYTYIILLIIETTYLLSNDVIHKQYTTQGFLYNACDALDVSLFLSKDNWHRINNVMAITYCALLAIYLMCNESDDANTVLRYAAFALVTVAQVFFFIYFFYDTTTTTTTTSGTRRILDGRISMVYDCYCILCSSSSI